MIKAIVLLLAAQAPSLPRGEITERLDGNISFVVHTTKRPVDLEFCVADVLTKMAAPASFSDGPERRIVIASVGGKVVGAIELNGAAAGTTIIGHIFAKGWDDRMRTRIEWCGRK